MSKPNPENTKAIHMIPSPQDKLGLQRFLGIINYLSKFIQNYSELTAPLRALLHQDTEWCWLKLHEAAFLKLKDALTSPPVLQYFEFHDFIYGRPAIVETQPPASYNHIKEESTHSLCPSAKNDAETPVIQPLPVISKTGKELYVADALLGSYLPSTPPFHRPC